MLTAVFSSVFFSLHILSAARTSKAVISVRLIIHYATPGAVD